MQTGLQQQQRAAASCSSPQQHHHSSRASVVVCAAAARHHARSGAPSTTKQHCVAGSLRAASPACSSSSSSSGSRQQRGAALAVAAAPPRASAAAAGSVDATYLAAAAFLAELGFANKTEIARVLDIAMNPNSLFVTASANANARPLTVEQDMRPVVDFLAAQGLPNADIVKVIGAHPPVLSYSVDGRLAPFWAYMASIGVPDVAAAVSGRPSLLGLDVDASLSKIVDYLKYVGTEPDKIVEMVCRSI